MDARAVAELQALRSSDDELAAAAARLRELGAAVAHKRARVEAIDTFMATYPEADGRRREAVADAERDLGRRRDELVAAEQALTAARGEEREALERSLSRARDNVVVAESRVQRARVEHEQLVARAAELPAELVILEAEAREVAASASHLPAVPATAGGRDLIEWAARAHSELFVALSQIDAQRERIIREANELASMLLGEVTHGSTVAQALRRVEGRG